MKYIITESKLEEVIIKFLNKMYGDLEEYRTDEYPNKVFYMKDNKIYMEHELENDMLWVGYETIWKDLENMFDLKISKIKYIISKWVEETYKLNGYSVSVEECPYNYFSKL